MDEGNRIQPFQPPAALAAAPASCSSSYRGCALQTPRCPQPATAVLAPRKWKLYSDDQGPQRHPPSVFVRGRVSEPTGWDPAQRSLVKFCNKKFFLEQWREFHGGAAPLLLPALPPHSCVGYAGPLPVPRVGSGSPNFLSGSRPGAVRTPLPCSTMVAWSSCRMAGLRVPDPLRLLWLAEPLQHP